MREEAIVLAEYLDIDIDNITEDDTNLFENTDTGEMYYVFLDSDLLTYIKDELTYNEIENARSDLLNRTYFSEYSIFFHVDEVDIEEHCMVNTEKVMNTEERVVFEYADSTYIIMKCND